MNSSLLASWVTQPLTLVLNSQFETLTDMWKIWSTNKVARL